jgi:hypothetical protein
MNRVRSGELPWTNFDRLHRLSLDQVLIDLDIKGFDSDAREELTSAWERLPPWPDSIPGLTRLGTRYTVSTLSNGNRSQQTGLMQFTGLPFQRLLSAEDFHHYKPDPEVYLGAASALGLEPGQVMMVSCPTRNRTLKPPISSTWLTSWAADARKPGLHRALARAIFQRVQAKPDRGRGGPFASGGSSHTPTRVLHGRRAEAREPLEAADRTQPQLARKELTPPSESGYPEGIGSA